jgi:uncharacterized protein YmfQ (DUF2313 family)
MSKHSIEQHTKRLLDLMPVGELMKDKYDQDTNHYKWWKAIAMYYVLLENNFDKLIDEFGISITETLIERWEKEFGIPDDVIDVAPTLAERRANVLLKKGGLNIINISEFQDIAGRLDLNVTVKTSEDIRFPPYSVPTLPMGDPMYKFLNVIEGDLTDPAITTLIAYFEKLLPINAGVITEDTNPATYPTYLPYDVPFDL